MTHFDRARLVRLLFILSLVAAVVICWEAFTGSPFGCGLADATLQGE